MTEPRKPLAGICVLDLTNVLAGPFACHQLAHLGADVIKIERPGKGDLARQLGASADLNKRNMGVSFLAQNAGKASVTLDLKTEDGRDIFLKLVQTADVVVENFRPGVMDRLRLGADTLRARNHRLVYCAISGFGQDGPWRDRPAYDQIVQGISGAMSVTGESGAEPLRTGFPIADTIGGLTAAMAISAALNAPDRGCVIDVSMLEATMATMAWVISNHLIAGVEPAACGNENPTSAPSGTFRTADGHINIAANKDEQWQALVSHIGREDLLEHPDYCTREARKVHRLPLRAEIETALTRRASDAWIDELNAVGVPAGPVLTVAQILSHPQIAARGFLADFDLEDPVRSIRTVRTGIKLDREPAKVDRPPPVLGADTDRILEEIGIDHAARATLRRRGII